MICVPPVGSICLVTFPKKFPKHSFKMKVIDTNVKGDSFGTIKYQVLSETVKRDGNKTKVVHTTKTSDVYDHKLRKYKEVPHKYVTEETDKNGHYIKVINMHSETKTFKDRFSVTEELWFDEEVTGRKVEICKK